MPAADSSGDASFSEDKLSEVVGSNKSFRDNWSPARSLESGNQGLAYEAVDANGVRAFIKEHKVGESNDSERRERFCREVLILRHLDVPGIPKLIETNAEYFADQSFALYLAAEYVDGERLTDVVNTGLEPCAAIDLLLQICTIVSGAHTAGVLHRDIKPDNVMVVRSDHQAVAHVVDFGMAHIDDVSSDFSTQRGQEAGNRFLRLPEYASGSPNKRDFRSDITFCVGLLFFALTKTKPATLIDHDNLHPHQRSRMRETLSQTSLDLGRLLSIFDIGFANDIGQRYQSFDALMPDLRRLRDDRPFQKGGASSAQRLRERYLTPERLAQSDIAKETKNLVGFVNTVLNEIVQDCGGFLQIGLSNFRTEADTASGNYTVTDPDDRLRRLSMTVFAHTIGAEHVLTVACEEGADFSLRYRVGTSLSDEELTRFRVFLQVQIDEATSDERFTSARPIQPSPYHPFADGENPPGKWLDEQEATHEYRPVVAVAWFRPHIRAGRPIISWSFTNVGSGTAIDVHFSFPGLALDSVPKMGVGETVTFERYFDEHGAYHDIMKGTVLGFVEFADREGHLYRQSLVVQSRPAQYGWEADYYTTQFGYPFLTKADQRMVKPSTDGSDPTYRTQSYRQSFPDD